MALYRIDNVGIFVDNLDAIIDFFRELGLEFEGRATIEGEWAGRVTGLAEQRRNRHAAHTGPAQPHRAFPLPLSAHRRESPQRPGERSRLPPRHVRRYSWASTQR